MILLLLFKNKQQKKNQLIYSVESVLESEGFKYKVIFTVFKIFIVILSIIAKYWNWL